MDRYHHGDLRSALVDAGMQLSRERGAAALGMRELTRAVGVSPNAAYRHFPNLRALVLTIAQEAQRRLSLTILDRMREVSGERDDHRRAVDSLRAFCHAYVDFALGEPGWFALACESSESPPGAPGDDPDAPPTPHEVLLGALNSMVNSGVMAAGRRVDAEWSCWSTVHGCAMLATAGPLAGLPSDAMNQVASRVIDTLLAGLTADAAKQ